MNDKIVIRGARENNLKNVTLEIPRNKLVVFTGVSESGKRISTTKSATVLRFLLYNNSQL